MSKKTALITGITGQDGSYLTDLLLEKGYSVHGLVRRTSTINRERLNHLFDDPHETDYDVELHYGDLSDALSIHRIIKKVKPDEIYHLGAQSHVGVSFKVPEYTGDVTGLSAIRILESIRQIDPSIKYYQASSSEMFGEVKDPTQSEKTPFHPRSPYGAAKVYAYWATVNYRESYDMFASNGILFNHESPRRGENFVSKKITYSLAKILAGKMDKLYLGNLNAKRDWGHARDYVEGMWSILQHDKPDDFVLATGETHTVREFVENAFGLVGINLKWEGKGLDEKGINENTGKVYVEIDEQYFRPSEVDVLKGDYSKAKKDLGWSPKITFKGLVKSMLKDDLQSFGIEDKLIN